VVVSPKPLNEKRWNELHKSVKESISIVYVEFGDKLEVVRARQELDALNRWKTKALFGNGNLARLSLPNCLHCFNNLDYILNNRPYKNLP